MKTVIFVVIFLFGMNAAAESTKTHYSKTQQVQFEGSEVDGVARTPDGANVVQKRGIQFVPLYDLKNHVNESIDSSVDYLK